jgi:septum formation protein
MFFMSSHPTLILASASFARRRLLEGAGIRHITQPSDFDETSLQCDGPAELVQRLAEAKALEVAQTIKASADKATLVLGCDSVLVLQNEIYGKPASPEEAIVRWQALRGRVGLLMTGHALLEVHASQGDSADGIGPMSSTVITQSTVRCRVTEVHFAKISDAEIEAYVATGEPLNCAGCFAIEGRGGAFIEKLVGCHSNVIGLSLPLLRQLLNDFGYSIADFWQQPTV